VESLLFFALILVAFYFLIIRPQRTRARQAAQLQARLVPGVEIMTTAGMFGRVVEVNDDALVLEVSPGVLVRFAKAAVGRIVDAEDTGENAAADDMDADDNAADDNDADDTRPDDTDATGDATLDADKSDVTHDQAGRGRTSAGE
jgi:preprotein translocase subunit YajC